MEKICITCKEKKDILQFNLNKCRKDGRQNFCRDCGQKRSRKYYDENKEKHREVTAARRKRQRKRIRGFINSIKELNPCPCGEPTFVCLDFHHLTGKDIGIAELTNQAWAKEKMLEEMRKCVILCSNCHRKHHSGVLVEMKSIKFPV